MAKYLIDIPECRDYFPDFLPTDDFYSGIYIANEHRKAWAKEFNTLMLKEMSLIEETSELTQAISKYHRNTDFTKSDACKQAITEEMAHVLISLGGLAWSLGIRSEDIQAEIEKKWPSAYSDDSDTCDKCRFSHFDVDENILYCTNGNSSIINCKFREKRICALFEKKEVTE